MKFNDKVYDVLKFIAQVALPGAGTLYFTVAQIWGLPNPEEVVGTVVAVDTFLGLLLGLSSVSYNNSDERFDGQINVEETEDRKLYSLELPVPPEELERKGEVTLKVNPPNA